MGAFQANHVMAQAFIDIDSPIEVRYDGVTAKTLQLEALLVYGFAYKVPVKISVAENLQVSNLHGSTICNCISLSIKNDHVLDSKTPTDGYLLIRPKSEDLFQDIDIMGTRQGEVDPILIAKIKLACEVFQPIRVMPEVIEVKDRRLLKTDIRVELADGLAVLDSQVVDSNSLLKFELDKKTQQVSISDLELPRSAESGLITLRFKISLMGQETLHDSIVAYEPTKPLRLIPKTLTFREVDSTYQTRFVIIGFSSAQSEMPRFFLEQETELGTWDLIQADFHIESFGFGKAVTKLSVDPKSIDLLKDKMPRFRLRNEDKSLVLEDIRAVLVR